jgi:hypothetical protein
MPTAPHSLGTDFSLRHIQRSLYSSLPWSPRDSRNVRPQDNHRGWLAAFPPIQRGPAVMSMLHRTQRSGPKLVVT